MKTGTGKYMKIRKKIRKGDNEVEETRKTEIKTEKEEKIVEK